jgi:hypothetical protein
MQMSVMQTVTFTSLSKVTVSHWFRIFKEKLPKNRELLEHLIQLDENYFKDKENIFLLKNM